VLFIAKAPTKSVILANVVVVFDCNAVFLNLVTPVSPAGP
jgi:hypothetical protein